MQWPKVQSSLARLLDFCPIAHEAFQSSVGQRMAHQLTEGFGGHGRRVSPQLDALEDMGGVAANGAVQLWARGPKTPGSRESVHGDQPRGSPGTCPQSGAGVAPTLSGNGY